MRKAISTILVVLGLILIFGGGIITDAAGYFCCISVGSSMVAIGIYVSNVTNKSSKQEEKSHGRMDKS